MVAPAFIILVALGAYTAVNRANLLPSSSTSSWPSGSNRHEGGRGGRNNGRLGGGARIKGMGDLPCDPKGG